MHPYLDESDKECGAVFVALRECHESSWYAKYVGSCNKILEEVHGCLHQQYLKRKAENHAEAKARRERYKEKLKELHRDD